MAGLRCRRAGGGARGVRPAPATFRRPGLDERRRARHRSVRPGQDLPRLPRPHDAARAGRARPPRRAGHRVRPDRAQRRGQDDVHQDPPRRRAAHPRPRAQSSAHRRRTSRCAAASAISPSGCTSRARGSRPSCSRAWPVCGGCALAARSCWRSSIASGCRDAVEPQIGGFSKGMRQRARARGGAPRQARAARPRRADRRHRPARPRRGAQDPRPTSWRAARRCSSTRTSWRRPSESASGWGSSRTASWCRRAASTTCAARARGGSRPSRRGRRPRADRARLRALAAEARRRGSARRRRRRPSTPCSTARDGPARCSSASTRRRRISRTCSRPRCARASGGVREDEPSRWRRICCARRRAASGSSAWRSRSPPCCCCWRSRSTSSSSTAPSPAAGLRDVARSRYPGGRRCVAAGDRDRRLPHLLLRDCLRHRLHRGLRAEPPVPRPHRAPPGPARAPLGAADRHVPRGDGARVPRGAVRRGRPDADPRRQGAAVDVGAHPRGRARGGELLRRSTRPCSPRRCSRERGGVGRFGFVLFASGISRGCATSCSPLFDDGVGKVAFDAYTTFDPAPLGAGHRRSRPRRLDAGAAALAHQHARRDVVFASAMLALGVHRFEQKDF